MSSAELDPEDEKLVEEDVSTGQDKKRSAQSNKIRIFEHFKCSDISFINRFKFL